MKKSEALNILGLQDGASDDDIKKAHRKLVIENHPDKFGADAAARAKAEEKTKLINEARDVLLSRKWTPEYSTAGTPYGAPFTYQPYTRPNGNGQNSQGDNPFAGWPFSGVDFVWTTWDAQGNPHTYRSSGEEGSSAGNPFGGIAPIIPSARRILSLARSPSTSPPSGKRARPNRCSKKRKDRFAATLKSLR